MQNVQNTNNGKSLLIEFLGDNTLTRVLDFLIERRPFDATKEEMIRETGVSRNSFFNVWEKIEKYRLVKKTREIGRATLYVLNEENGIVRQLLELELTLIRMKMGAEIPAGHKVGHEVKAVPQLA